MRGLGLGLRLQQWRRGGGGAPPLTALFISSTEAQAGDAAGTDIGQLLPIGGTSPFSYVITSDPSSLLQISSGDPKTLQNAADLTGHDGYAFQVEVTDAKGAQKTLSTTLSVVADSSSGNPSGSLDYTGDFDINPKAIDSSTGVKLSGKNNGIATVIYDFGAASAGYIYTVRYTAELSNMKKEGTQAAFGIGLKDGNNFHLFGVKGDGVQPQAATTEHDTEIYGDFSAPKSFTIETGATDANASVEGENFEQLELSGDGTTVTFRTSADGVNWDDILVDVDASPLTNPDSGNITFAGYLTKQDNGPFVIDVNFTAIPPFSEPSVSVIKAGVIVEPNTLQQVPWIKVAVFVEPV